MLVKVNASLAGLDFSFHFGAIVDSAEFAAKVGNGWENLCDPVEAGEGDKGVFEKTDAPPVTETATIPVVTNTSSPRRAERRGPRK